MEKKLEMKRCKECGELFMPTSNKQKYCTKGHYRPCPICGKLVFAKYLSDPARCCSGVCKSKLGKKNNIDAKVKSNLVPMPGAEKLSDLAKEYCRNDAQALLEVAEEMIDPTDNTIRKRYEGQDIPGSWINGHEYAVSTEHVDKEYHVIATYDYTDRNQVFSQYSFTNKKKISNIFKACK